MSNLKVASAKAEALIEIMDQCDAASVFAAALQLLPDGELREKVVAAIAPLSSESDVIRDIIAIHAPKWGGAAGREVGRLAIEGDKVALVVLLSIAKADDGDGVTLAECFGSRSAAQ